MTAVIALSKCSQTKKTYGIRFERTGRDWKYTWASGVFFSLNQCAGNSGFVIIFIQSSLFLNRKCPHCGAKGFFYCGCGKLNCWNGESRVVTCSWCGATGKLSVGIDSIHITGNL